MPHRASNAFQLSVVNENGRWLMLFRGRRIAFVDRLSALREAVRQAHQFSKDGSPTQVVCVDDAGSKIIWTSGLDPAPDMSGQDAGGIRVHRATRSRAGKSQRERTRA